MVRKIDAYVDTSALIAFLDRSDTYHPLFLRLFSAPPQLITSTLVIAEAHGWFLRRYDRGRALQFMSMIEVMKPLKVLSVGTTEQNAGTRLLRRFPGQDLTLADTVGLHLMEIHHVEVCWSTDFNLGLTGVPLAIHASGNKSH